MTAVVWEEDVDKLIREVALKRARGDNLRRQGKNDEADVEFRAAIGVLDRTLHRLGQVEARASSDEEKARARKLVEVHGARAGLLRRVGDTMSALKGYSIGADLERRLAPESTYNRTNEIKLGLLTGTHDLATLSPNIEALERQLTKSLDETPSLGDDGWAWADLGDLRALRGDAEGAERAYSTFIAKAKPAAPRTTLDVLRSILEVLEQTRDARATTVHKSLEFVQANLNLR
jgi:hypothetical protein